MRLLITVCIALLATGVMAQDMTSPAYKEQLKQLWLYVKDSETGLQGKQLLVVQQSFPYKQDNKKKLAYGNPDFFKNYLSSFEGGIPAKIYKKEILNGNETGVMLDSVMLTKAEREMVAKYLKGNKQLTWTTDLLGDVTFVSSSDIDEYCNNYKGDAPEYPRTYYSLSAPLFFKNNTMALFYWGHEGGSSAGGVLNMYVKRNGGWIKLIELYSWEN